MARRAGPRGALYLSMDETWRTPPALFAELATEFNLVLDVAALVESALCPAWFGPDHPDPHRRDALRYDDWAEPARSADIGVRTGFCWANPPYGSGLGEWTSRAVRTAKNGVGVVGLLPARTDTKFWHRDILDAGAEVRFLRGRLRFSDSSTAAPFASVVVVWRP